MSSSELPGLTRMKADWVVLSEQIAEGQATGENVDQLIVAANDLGTEINILELECLIGRPDEPHGGPWWVIDE